LSTILATLDGFSEKKSRPVAFAYSGSFFHSY